MAQENTINIFAGTGENSILSNFAVRPFVAGVGHTIREAGYGDSDDELRIQFDSVEQAFQFTKTFYSTAPAESLEQMRESILSTDNGAELRRLGRSVPALDSASWDAVSENYMRRYVRASFVQNKDAAQALVSTGDATLAHEQDNTRWRALYPQILMDLRTEYINAFVNSRDPRDEEVAAVSNITVNDVNRTYYEMSKDFDILTLGTGKRKQEDFFSLIPPGVTMVIDARNWNKSSRLPQFDVKNLRPALSNAGLRYEYMPQLSGKSKNKAFSLAGNPKEFDWVRMSASPDVRNGIQQIQEFAAAGEKVLIISSDSDPRFGNRAMFLGQMLESSGLSVGHISTDREGNGRLQSNRDVIQDIIGHRTVIDGGSYINLHFQSDRSVILEPGVSLRRINIQPTIEERLIPGNWNYSQRVAISQLQSQDVNKDVDPLSFKATYIENARYADVTIVFSVGGFDKETKHAKEAADGKVVTVRVQNSRQTLGDDVSEYMTVKELLSDDLFIDKVAKKIHSDISNNLTLRMLANDNLNVDTEHLKINIAGTHIAHIANERVITADQDDISNTDLSVLAEGGLHVETTDVTQEDVNHFMTNVLNRLPSYNSPDSLQLGIGEVRTNGQTGVAEAAVIAAQSLGIETSILATKKFAMTLDDETVQGMLYRDEAMFKNRFHQGLRNDVTLDELRAAAMARNAQRREDEELGIRIGLSDSQILLLQRLGFSNNDVIDMVEMAEVNNVFITSDEDMMEFLINCSGNGISGVEYITTEMIAQRREEMEDFVFRAAENGISYITVNSPEYPENLRQFEDIESTEYEEILVPHDVPAERINEVMAMATVDGILHTELIPEDVLQNGQFSKTRIPHTTFDKRPAILWYKGDINLLNSPSVSLNGAANPSESIEALDETTGIAKALGEKMAGENVTAITPLVGGSGLVAAGECIDRGGKAIGFSTDAIDGPEMGDMKDQITRNEGLVISEKAPGNIEQPERKDSHRAKIFSTSLGYAAAFIDGMVNSKPLSAFDMAAYSVYGSVALVTAPFRLAERLRDKAIDPHVTETAAIDELSKVTDRARNAYGVGAEEQNSVKEQAHPDHGDEIKRDMEEKHPKQLEVPVIKFGKKSVYFVDKNYPDVREALKKRFGEDIQFASRGEEDKIYNMMANRAVSYNGETKNGFKGYRGTQPQEKEPVMFSLYFVNDRIETLLETADTTLGLAPRKQRIADARMMSELKKEAKAMQMEMQAAAGIHSKRGFRFDNADYLVIKANSIEIRRGNEMRAKVYIGSNGLLCIKNNTLLVNDLQEHGRRQFKVFSRDGIISGKMTAKDILDEMRATIFDRCKAESEALTPNSRAEEEQMQREVEEGFLVIREDNITVATQDVCEAQKMGLISGGDGEEIDKLTAMGLMNREIASVEKRIKAMKKELAASQKALDKAVKEDIKKKGDGKSVQEREELEGQRKEEIAALEEKLETIQANILADMSRLEYLVIHKQDIAFAEQLAVVATAGKNEGKSLEIEGLVIPVASTAKLTEKQAEQAAKDIESIKAMYEQQGVAQQQEQEKARIENEERERAAAAEREKEQAREAEKAAAREERMEKVRDAVLTVAAADVIMKISDNVSVARVGSKQAFVNADLEVTGELYSKINVNKNLCSGFREDGQFKLIYPNGQEVVPVWLQGISSGTDGVSIIKSDGLFNHLNVAQGKLLDDAWMKAVGTFKDGWSLVQSQEGKFNYINTKGESITQNWFDAASEFSNGVAKIRRGEQTATIDATGTVLSVGKDNGMGGPGSL